MNYTLFLKYLSVIGLLLFLNACTYKKKLIYFNKAGQLASSDANKNYTPIFKSDDLLSIIVLGLNEDAVKPFNLPVVQLSFNNGYTLGSQPPPGYLIDANGNVEMPVIGKMKLAGLTRMVAVDSITQRLKPYLTSPTVLMRILNYKVTVLGEVRNPGTFTIPNERITIIEALGLAGDLNITAVRNNVMVVRDENGKKTEYRIDLTAKDVFASPVYYLNQNDVVYIEPNRAKINSSVINAANAGIIISSISLIITVLALLTR